MWQFFLKLRRSLPPVSLYIPMGHFRVALNLIMKPRLSAKFLLRKLVFIHEYANKTNFHMKIFALSLAFIMRFTATRKWTIEHLLRSAFSALSILTAQKKKKEKKATLYYCACVGCAFKQTQVCQTTPRIAR